MESYTRVSVSPSNDESEEQLPFHLRSDAWDISNGLTVDERIMADQTLKQYQQLLHSESAKRDAELELDAGPTAVTSSIARLRNKPVEEVWEADVARLQVLIEQKRVEIEHFRNILERISDPCRPSSDLPIPRRFYAACADRVYLQSALEELQLPNVRIVLVPNGTTIQQHSKWAVRHSGTASHPHGFMNTPAEIQSYIDQLISIGKNALVRLDTENITGDIYVFVNVVYHGDLDGHYWQTITIEFAKAEAKEELRLSD